jgi:hypothetical protein
MKTKIYLSIIIIALFGCEKEYSSTNRVSSTATSNSSSDGILTVNASILPPVTPQTFIRGGGTSTSVYDFTASQYFEIDLASLTSSSIVKSINGQPSPGGIETTDFSGYITIKYKNVNSRTSPRISTVTLKEIDYHTNDYVSHYLTVDSISGTCPPVCVVYNIAQLGFSSPKKYHPNPNGYTEAADVLLYGDTAWTLNSLPMEGYDARIGGVSFPYAIAKYNGVKVGEGSPIHFNGGFKHIAGQTDTLKIFYKIQIGGGELWATSMGDLNNFEWIDGVGGLITGELNSQFYKEQTGEAILSY